MIKSWRRLWPVLIAICFVFENGNLGLLVNNTAMAQDKAAKEAVGKKSPGKSTSKKVSSKKSSGKKKKKKRKKPSEANRKKAREIIKKAEELRFLGKTQSDVDLKTIEGEKEITYDLKVLSSDQKRAYIEFLAPKEERGRKMLARDKQYWTTFPDSKMVHAISKKEMIGNSAFAMADVFQIDPDKDYNPAILGETKDKKGKKLIHLEMDSLHDDTPYHRIEYWVEKDGYFPVKAAMFAKSGKHVKTMYVESRKKYGDRIRPETTKMVDEIQENKLSWWTNREVTPVDVPDEVFTKEFLKRRN